MGCPFYMGLLLLEVFQCSFESTDFIGDQGLFGFEAGDDLGEFTADGAAHF